jgi:hypothetical protein
VSKRSEDISFHLLLTTSLWLVAPEPKMYIVHMKRVTASEARRNWFRLLDEVAAGETVVIERHGRRILIRREAMSRGRGAIPDYSGILKVREPDRAAEWGWEWDGPEGELRPRDEP